MFTGKMTVAGIYVTPQRRASLLRMGMSDSFAEACCVMVMDMDGDNMVAKALRSNEAICIENGKHSMFNEVLPIVTLSSKHTRTLTFKV